MPAPVPPTQPLARFRRQSFCQPEHAMRVRPVLAAFLLGCTTVLAAARGADDAGPPTDGPLAAVAPYVGGEWHLDGTWTNRQALKAREVFTWGLGNKFVEVRTWVSRADGSG